MIEESSQQNNAISIRNMEEEYFLYFDIIRANLFGGLEGENNNNNNYHHYYHY